MRWRPEVYSWNALKWRALDDRFLATPKVQQAGPWQETDAHFPLCWEGGNGLSESPHHGTCLLSPPSEGKQPRLPFWGEDKHANKKANIKARSVSQTPPMRKVQLRHIELPDNSCRASFQSRNRLGALTTYLKKLRNAGDAGSAPGSEDPLQKEMATHSSILAWETPQEEPGGLQHRGRKESDTTDWLSTHPQKWKIRTKQRNLERGSSGGKNRFSELHKNVFPLWNKVWSCIKGSIHKTKTALGN